jgi:hypothetical protein
LEAGTVTALGGAASVVGGCVAFGEAGPAWVTVGVGDAFTVVGDATAVPDGVAAAAGGSTGIPVWTLA